MLPVLFCSAIYLLTFVDYEQNETGYGINILTSSFTKPNEAFVSRMFAPLVSLPEGNTAPQVSSGQAQIEILHRSGVRHGPLPPQSLLG